LVTLKFKLSDRDDLVVSLSETETLGDLLSRVSRETGTELGGVIAVRQGKVMARSQIVEDQDIIEIYPAISGG